MTDIEELDRLVERLRDSVEDAELDLDQLLQTRKDLDEQIERQRARVERLHVRLERARRGEMV